MKVFGIVTEQPQLVFDGSGESRKTKESLSIRIVKGELNEEEKIENPVFYDVGIRSKRQLISLRDSINDYLKYEAKDDFPDKRVNVPIELPFDSDKFISEWEVYVQFLKDVFSINLTPIEQMYRANKIHDINDGNEAKSIELIRYLITGRYKSVFKPEDWDLE